MKNKIPEILLKVFLAGVEFVFVGLLCYLRLLNMGWLLLIFGLLLVPWVFIHLGLITIFIINLRLRLIDIALYLAVHFFYLWAWLFQSDGGDSGGARWTVQAIFDLPALFSFLQKWGDTLFWITISATFVCYLIIIVRLVISWNASIKRKQPALASTMPGSPVPSR